jgi:hypothetical protein
MICPNGSAITVSYEQTNQNLGGERIIIHPGICDDINKQI